MIYTSSIFAPVDETLYYICSASAQKAELNVVGGLGVEDLGWGRGKCASLFTGSSV